jgi:hypothetical protein
VLLSAHARGSRCCCCFDVWPARCTAGSAAVAVVTQQQQLALARHGRMARLLAACARGARGRLPAMLLLLLLSLWVHWPAGLVPGNAAWRGHRAAIATGAGVRVRARDSTRPDQPHARVGVVKARLRDHKRAREVERMHSCMFTSPSNTEAPLQATHHSTEAEIDCPTEHHPPAATCALHAINTTQFNCCSRCDHIVADCATIASTAVPHTLPRRLRPAAPHPQWRRRRRAMAAAADAAGL